MLAKHIDRTGARELRTLPTHSVFGGLAQAIVYQQLSTRAAGTIYRRVLALPGGAGPDLQPEQSLCTSDDDLRAAGVSKAKRLALRDLAERTVAGLLPGLADVRAMRDDQVVESLTAVRGIGRWSAQMFLIFRLGRTDVLPVADFGLRKGFGLVFGEPSPAEDRILSHGERWRPHRTVTSWYLWRAAGGGLQPD